MRQPARGTESDWPLIVSLYDRLRELTDSPVVRLNRAIALSHRDGGAVGLGELEPLAGELDGYHLFHTAGAEMLRHLGRERDAVASLPRALELTANPAEKRLLAKRLAGIVLSPRPTAFHPPTPVFAGTGR